MRTIAEASGSGDAPGLNAVIRRTPSETIQAARGIGTTFGGSA
jgi:6-phosphofructokinase